MINRKKSILNIFIFPFFVLMTIVGCNKDEFLTLEKEQIDTNTLQLCEASEDCASVEINILRCLSDSEICDNINAVIEKTAVNILNLGEDGEEDINATIANFNTSYQQMKAEFTDETISYEVNIDYEISFQNNDLISLVVDSYIFTGGAHGSSAITLINLHTKTGKQIPINTLIKDLDRFKKYVETRFRKKYSIPENAPINSTGFLFDNDAFSLPDNIGFSNTDVILIYNRFEVSSAAEGSIELRLKKEDVASFFNLTIL